VTGACSSFREAINPTPGGAPVSWPRETLNTLKSLRAATQMLKELFVSRDDAIDLLALAVVSQEHLLLLGPPGTAKTELVTRFTQLVQARGFHYLVTRFTEPSEVFGPLDLQRFQQGTYHVCTEGMLPEAEIAFLDEVFQGNSAMLNGFLSLVHERVFHNGSVPQEVPLLALIGASNDLPSEPTLQAFADRFLLRCQVPPVARDQVRKLVETGWENELARITKAAGGGSVRLQAQLKAKELTELHGRLREVILDDVRQAYTDVMNEARSSGVDLSDRRVVKGQKLVAAAALLREADRAEPRDFWPLLHVWNRPEDASTLAQVLAPRLKDAGPAARPPGRPAADLAEDHDVLEAQERDLRHETQIIAHLSRYNDLRRELLRDHRGNTDLQQRNREAVERLMGRLARREESHV
jgi:MoxR-like ATPase